LNKQKSPETILIVTVGGSYQPVVKAITDLRPDFVVFICTGKDEATGRPGSDIQIIGKGNCIKAHQQDEKPSLPAIPLQTGLQEEQYQLVKTMADDLDRIYLDCTKAIENLSQQYPHANIYADYTGGTKSMSAGLVMAALEFPHVELQLVTGSRSDLVKVHDGSELSALANIEQIRFQRALAPYRQCWRRYAYSEALEGLDTLKIPRQTTLRAEYLRFKDISQAFAEWDNFNHAEALDILKRYAPNLPGHLKGYIPIVQRLNNNDPLKQEAARLFDLYLNAQRRARQGRYDDAIARIYRLIEWTAQWLLRKECQIETNNIAPENIPAGINISPNREGQYQAGLYAAWELVKHHTQGAAAEFFNQYQKELLNHIKTRNNSILAHGFSPVEQSQWRMVSDFMQQTFMPMLLTESGFKSMPAQLPDDY